MTTGTLNTSKDESARPPGGISRLYASLIYTIFFLTRAIIRTLPLTLLSDYRRFFFAKFDGERDLEELQLSVVPSKTIKLKIRTKIRKSVIPRRVSTT